MATRLEDQIGRVLGGRYRLLAPIGTGASAQVFLADDTTLRRRVAVKVLHPSLAGDDTFLRRFRREAQAAAALNHPHIVAIYDWGQEDVPYLVGEYLGGGSLRAMLDAGHRLSPSQALLVGLEAARGMEYAHRRGIVHRDIKPANLLFDEDGRLRIADFGLARALAEAGWTEPHGTVVGTARYASPEQARGEPLTGRSDIYALALVLVEAVTGEVPFGADTALGTLMARVDQQVPVPEALGPLRRALEWAGRSDPDERPDAGELIIALMATAEELERPRPLPLVGALAPVEAPRDPTSIAPTPLEAPAPPEAPAPSEASEPDRVIERIEKTPEPRTPPPQIPLDDDADGPRRRWPWVVLGVLLVLGGMLGGAAAYLANRTISHEVPDLVGVSVEELSLVAEERRWELTAEPGAARTDDVPTGHVIGTDPPAGERLAEGGLLHYTVSIGPTLVGVPSLLGEELSAARDLLAAAGLRLAEPPVEEHHEEVPAGHVLGVLTPEPELPRGEEVELVVSLGPAPRTVPEGLEGGSLAAARDALEALGLVAAPAEKHSETVASGAVIELVPGPGELVERGAEVTVVVSIGPAPRAVPDVEGRSVAEATEILRGAGFVIDGVDGDPSRPVLTTDPPAEEVHPYGTRVRIIARRS